MRLHGVWASLRGGSYARSRCRIASPVILAGLRTSAVQVVATAPLGALVAYGGLGRFIIDGFATRDNVQIFAGALLVALLSVLTEVVFSLLERRLVPQGCARDGSLKWPCGLSEPSSANFPGM